MKQTAFVPVTILAGLAVVFLAPQWRLSAEEPPRLQQQGNGPRKERAPDRPDRGREPMHDHKQFSNEGGPIMDRLMRRFDEVITRLDRIEHRVFGITTQPKHKKAQRIDSRLSRGSYGLFTFFNTSPSTLTKTFQNIVVPRFKSERYSVATCFAHCLN